MQTARLFGRSTGTTCELNLSVTEERYEELSVLVVLADIPTNFVSDGREYGLKD